MSDKRTAGRPVRGLNDVERLRILEASRSFLRLNADGEFTRRDLADFVGVAPALISYYFPERSDLVRAAVAPIIEQYSERLSIIDRSDLSQPDKLIAIVCLLVECNLRDRAMIKAFYAVNLAGPGFTGSKFMRLLSTDITGCIAASVDKERSTYYGLDFIMNSLWNVCESAAVEVLSMVQAADNPSRRADTGLTVTRDPGLFRHESQSPPDEQEGVNP